MNKNLTEGRPSAVLLRYCLPLFGSIVFQQLYNIADSFVAGRFISQAALAAVGNAYEVTLVYLAFATGLCWGASVVISQLFGAKRYRECKTAIYTACIMVFAVCVTLMVLGFSFAPSLLTLINTPAEHMADSMLYLNIYTGGLVFLFFYNIATGIFSALGDSKTPFYFLAVSSVSNIFMDIWFVKSFNMGVAGVAWATFICQGVSCVLSCAVLIGRVRKIPSDGKVPLFSLPMLREIALISGPSTLQQLCVSVGNIMIQSVINSFGEAVMAGYAAAIKLNNFFITTTVNMGSGMSNFAAQNIGAGLPERIRKGLKSGILINCTIAALFFTVNFGFSETVVGFFMDGNSPDALAVGVKFLRITAPFYLFPAIKIMVDAVLRGCGFVGRFTLTAFIDLVIRVGLSFLLPTWFESTGVWMSWPLGWGVGMCAAIYFYRTGCWQRSALRVAGTEN